MTREALREITSGAGLRPVKDLAQLRPVGERAWRALVGRGLSELAVACAITDGCTVSELLNRDRGGAAGRARTRLVHELVSLRLTKSDIGRLLQLDHTSVRYHASLPIPSVRTIELSEVRERQEAVLRALGARFGLRRELAMPEFLHHLEMLIAPAGPGPVPEIPDLVLGTEVASSGV